MDKVIQVTANFLQKSGLYATSLHLRKARKNHTCSVCKEESILAGDYYYQVVHAGAGLRDMKFPDRVCRKCVEGDSPQNA
jgi:hypothetical protein